ncbi:hypothetical protein ACTI_46380 [Actinoplanes sp. OR16]|nr:hypothetical protein ACTI_46380 [Actinoplanes sp. OR16]
MAGRVAEQRLRHRVPVEQVEMPAEDDRRGLHHSQQPPGAVRHPVRLNVEPGGHRPAGGVGQGQQVPAFAVVEAERTGDRLQDVVGRAYFPALLHALVVVGAQPGQQSDLLTPEPGDLAPAARFQADVVRAQPVSPGAQEITELTSVRMRAAHAASVPRPGPPKVGPADLGNRVRPNGSARPLASSAYRTDTSRSSR